jgi:hypothetical protein
VVIRLTYSTARVLLTGDAKVGRRHGEQALHEGLNVINVPKLHTL